jgi:hypothetical protein
MIICQRSVCWSVRDTYLDDADMQIVNQEGSASEAVEGAEDWTWDKVEEDHGNGNNGKEDIEVTA